MIVMIRYACSCGPRTIMEKVFEPGFRLRKCSYNGCASIEEADVWIRENAPKLKDFSLVGVETIDTDAMPKTIARPWTDGSTDADIVRGRY